MLPFLLFIISEGHNRLRVLVISVEITCCVKFYVFMFTCYENQSMLLRKGKYITVTDCFLVRTHPYKLLTVLFLPFRRSAGPGIKRRCYFSASKNTKLLKEAGRSLSKRFVFFGLQWVFHVSFLHWYKLLKTWSLCQAQCFSVSCICMAIAKWWIRNCSIKIWSLVVWKV